MMVKALHLILWTLLVDSISANVLCTEEDAPFIVGYKYYSNVGCYKLYTLPSTWGYAWKQCKEDGGHLVVIDSDEEHRVVREMMKESKKGVYIGVHDTFVEGWFFTVTGKCLLPSSYNNWRDGEPDDNYSRNNGDCVVINKNGELQDEDCTEGLYFICEIELR